MTDHLTDLHAFLDLARFRDHLSVTVTNGGTLMARIEGPVLAADAAVGIDLLDGAPYVLRNGRGVIWAPVRFATLSRDGQAIATYNDAQQTPPQATTAPQTAPQPEPGHGDGDEAERAAEAAARAGWEAWAAETIDPDEDNTRLSWADLDDKTRADLITHERIAIAAAEPHIRAKIADEIEGARLGGNAWDYDGGLETAARIARQEQP